MYRKVVDYMFYRIECYSEEENEWLGMFRHEDISTSLSLELIFSVATSDFNMNLKNVNSARYCLNKSYSCHCYFTSKGYKRFKDSIREYLKLLSKEKKIKIIRIKEDKYDKFYIDEYQTVLRDKEEQ